MSIELLILYYIIYIGGIYSMLSPSNSGEQRCPPGKKESLSYVDTKIVNKTCISLQNLDVSMIFSSTRKFIPLQLAIT